MPFKVNDSEYDLLGKLTREEDDIHQSIAWGAFADLGCIVNSCRLFRDSHRGNYLVRLNIPNGDHRGELDSYCSHMENLCYGNDLRGRAHTVRTYPRKGSTGNISMWFYVAWPEEYQLTHKLERFVTTQQ